MGDEEGSAASAFEPGGPDHAAVDAEATLDEAQPPVAATSFPGDRADERTAAVEGPRGWVVLAATAVVAALIIGGVFGWRVWPDGDDDTMAASDPTAATVPSAMVASDVEGRSFTRVTEAGIEIRSQLTGQGNMRFGGVAVAGTMVATEEGLAAPDAVAPTEPASTEPGLTAPPDADAIDGRPLPGPGGENSDEDVPAFCVGVDELTVWAISDTTIAQAGLTLTAAAAPELGAAMMWSGGAGGGGGGVQIFGVVVQVPDDVTSVRLTTPQGGDEMKPIEGVAALAVEVSGEAAGDLWSGDTEFLDRAVLSARRLDGTSMRTSGHDLQMGPPIWTDPTCFDDMVEGPPATMPVELDLPEPGEQPADPDAARTAIEQRFASLYGDGATEEMRRDMLDDPSGIEDVVDQLVENGFGEEAATSGVTVEDLVFVSPTEAVFSYRLDASGIDWGLQYGRAKFVDGRWKITRGTLCQDLEKAGAVCPP